MAPHSQQTLVELKPCPFCGESLRVVPQFYDRDFREQEPVYLAWHSGVIGDGNCMFSGKGFYERQWPIWNTRTLSQEQTTDRRKA